MFGTCFYAQAAGFARGLVHEDRLLPLVCEAFQLSFQTQTLSLRLRQGTNRKDRNGTGTHAIGLSFAGISVYHGTKCARPVFAFFGVGQKIRP